MFICVNNLWLFIHILWIYFFFFQNCINYPLWYKIQLVRKKKKKIMLHAKWEALLRILVLSVFKATFYLAWLAALRSIIMFWQALSDTKQSSLSL